MKTKIIVLATKIFNLLGENSSDRSESTRFSTYLTTIKDHGNENPNEDKNKT
jgi:hypothetical protein